MSDIKLINITSDNWEKICCLYPGKEGAEYVASNSFSIAQSVFENGWNIRGIVKSDLLIGFTMYGFSQELQEYELCRFMIDHKYQGNGYGKQSLKIIIDEMFNQYRCKEIYLSTSPDNKKGKHIYRDAGFVFTGKTCGEEDDLEEIFCLKH
ncbi:GNAT family N-acetyltransferase [Clostridium cadaveris]|uniref:GNAT family N-acetyltransferase n=1 Tax=Clostridium cadaveris TaxID=1529 RepID=UPI001459B45E|nr:GNAT family N-acetyltransferase [Clostridium cadaveris]NME63046.1 GNAT family N-acetyltransferase [Clostridium cadaveris]